jgi:hypothetical protein
LVHGVEGVVHCVERNIGVGSLALLSLVPTPLERCVLSLDAGGVLQQDAYEVCGGLRAVDGASEAVTDEPREVAAVVEVGVREEDGVQRRWVNGEWIPVAGVRSRSWYRPQSMRMRVWSSLRRNREPVTLRVAPRKVMEGLFGMVVMLAFLFDLFKVGKGDGDVIVPTHPAPYRYLRSAGVRGRPRSLRSSLLA